MSAIPSNPLPTHVSGRVIIRKSPQRTNKVRYGRRIMTIKSRTIIVDFKKDDTVDLFIMQDDVTTHIATGITRQKARLAAKNIATFMEAFEDLTKLGKPLISLVAEKS